MKKFFAFLLGVLMLCSAFVMNSCEENDGDDTAETTKPSVSTIIDDVKKTTNDSSDVVDPEETTNGGGAVDPDIGGKNVLDGVRYNGETKEKVKINYTG